MHAQNQQQKDWKKVWNMFRVNNKDIFSVFAVDLEKVNACMK